MPTVDVEARTLADTTDGFASVGGVHESNHARQLNLIITSNGDGHRLQVQCGDQLSPAFAGVDLTRSYLLPISSGELWTAVQECRQAWHDYLVSRRARDGTLVFQKFWDFSGSSDYKDALLHDLAKAGYKLFLTLFSPRDLGGGDDAASIRDIGRVLSSELAKSSVWLRVTASSFFAPWNLIYSSSVPVERGPVDPEGFWGYQHVVEHAPEDSGRIGYELRASDCMKLGMQVDSRIDAELEVPCVSKVTEAFDSQSRLAREDRNTKLLFEQALRSGPVDESILYFCCHAVQEGSTADLRIDQGYLTLSDQPRGDAHTRITTSDIEFAMDTRSFANHPMVFLNTCEGGQINSLFYKGFARKFLELEACSVVGPQTEIPAVFAGEFGKRFFERFLTGGVDNSVGLVLFDLRREFFDTFNNPLGLLYSVYRGADTHV